MFDERQPNERELAAELAALERSLRGLTPAAPRIDRDRLMFAAGQAASAASVARAEQPGRHGRAIYDQEGRPIYIAGPFWAGRRFWPAATATMTAASLLLATMLVWQSRSQSVTQQTAKPPAAVEVVSTPRATDLDQADRVASRDTWSRIGPTSGYLGIRYIALTRGVDSLSPDLQISSGARDLPSIDQRIKPVTARGLLDELLPESARSIQSRS